MIFIVAALAAIAGMFVGYKTGLFHPILDWIKEFVTQDIPDLIWPLLPQGVADYFRSVDVQAFADLVTDASWFIPIWQVLGIYFTAFAFAGTLLFLRYVIGWIPTVEG